MPSNIKELSTYLGLLLLNQVRIIRCIIYESIAGIASNGILVW
jgi:hypothetical protein